jgi:hypothetical protein
VCPYLKGPKIWDRGSIVYNLSCTIFLFQALDCVVFDLSPERGHFIVKLAVILLSCKYTNLNGVVFLQDENKTWEDDIFDESSATKVFLFL